MKGDDSGAVVLRSRPMGRRLILILQWQSSTFIRTRILGSKSIGLFIPQATVPNSKVGLPCRTA